MSGEHYPWMPSLYDRHYRNGRWRGAVKNLRTQEVGAWVWAATADQLHDRKVAIAIALKNLDSQGKLP